MSFFTVALSSLGFVLILMFALWLISLPIKNSSIVDIFWGVGFVIIVWLTFFLSPGTAARGLLVAGLTTLWGLRLSGYLTWRNYGKGEDERYGEMRKKYGDLFPVVSLFVVFVLQGVIMWIVSFPIQTVHFAEAELGWLDGVGAAVWLIGWLFESIGDWQLAHFKSQPENQGEVMDQGLWRYTRHPNYFGDFLVWWGFYVVALAGGGWWTVFSPLLMSFLLLRVSGVTLLEKSLKDKRPGYKRYVARTSAFFPWPPKDATASS